MNNVEIEKEFGIPNYRVSKILATAEKKMREQSEKNRRARVCKRLRDKVEKKNSLAGLLLSTDETYSDQEAVARYFDMGLI